MIRYVGLYHATRGAHTFFLRAPEGKVDRPGNYVINLIHYEDAASLAVEALQHGTKGALYLGCDGHPVTFSDMMRATTASPRFAGSPDITFTGSTDGPPTGKVSVRVMGGVKRVEGGGSGTGWGGGLGLRS